MTMNARHLCKPIVKTEAKAYEAALEYTEKLIDGFESPFGMELLATVDWLLSKECIQPTVQAVREGLQRWPAGTAERKNRLFDDRAIEIALKRLTTSDSQLPWLEDRHVGMR